MSWTLTSQVTSPTTIRRYWIRSRFVERVECCSALVRALAFMVVPGLCSGGKGSGSGSVWSCVCVCLVVRVCQGWTRQVGALQRALMKEGHHTTAFAVGNSHTVVLANDGSLYTWGWSDRGQLGHGDKTHREEPALVRYFEGSLIRGAGWTAKYVVGLCHRPLLRFCCGFVAALLRL